MNTVNQATENHVLTDAQLNTVNGAMTAAQRYAWHLDRQKAFRAGEEWRIPRPVDNELASTIPFCHFGARLIEA